MDDQIEVIQRDPAARKDCPRCGESIGYYWFSGMADLVPHFYCNHCSNAYHDEQHKQLMYENEKTKELIDQIANTLPSCECGGCFKPGQSPKCPHCQYELQKINDPLASLTYSYLILVEGAKLFLRR